MKKKFKKIYTYLNKLKDFIINGSQSEGYVELINPQLISGWVKSDKLKFHEIRLIDNDNVLASTPINIFRNDVNNKFNLNRATGFNLQLKKINKIILDPKLIAITADGKNSYEIKLTHTKESFKDKLTKLLNSNLLFCKGKIHSLSSDGQVLGWAFSPSEKKEIDIWLQTIQGKPIKVKCNQSLHKLPLSALNENQFQLPLNCAINFNLNDLVNKEQVKELIFTFDKEGFYPLETTRRLFIGDKNSSLSIDVLSRGSAKFVNYIKSLEKITEKSDVKRWLPWRLIAKKYDLSKSNSKLTYNNIYLEQYQNTFYNEGTSIRSLLENYDVSSISDSIRDYFDDEYYSAYEDLKDCDDVDLLEHYIVFGKDETHRNPNAIFNTNKFLNLYPWVKKFNIQPFFLFINWPEQFIEFKNNILFRSEIISNEPFSREMHNWALHDPKKYRDKNNLNYKRILYLTEEISSIERRIKPKLDNLKIHFVIPDFSKGSGGHMTIFRLISHLESFGHKVFIWIKDYKFSNHPEGPAVDIKRDFLDINADVFELNSHFAFVSGDAIVATSWDTVELVKAQESFNDKFYLVQDFEPLFYPTGSQSLKSEETYKSELKTICASKWLDKTMREKYNKTSCYFDLSFNKEIFDNSNFKIDKEIKLKDKDVIRIAFYGRIFTERRAVELALDGLEELGKYGYNICLEIFGIEKNEIKIPDNIEGVDNGILSSFELSKIYKYCDIGIAFSATNYSLVPPEMMASGLPVLELSTESNRIIYPENVVKFAEPNPLSISNSLRELIENDDQRNLIINNAYKWITKSSWEKSFKGVAKFIQNEVQNAIKNKDLCHSFYERYKKNNYEVKKVSEIKNCLVSVVIPTYNGGNLLNEVIDKLLKQEVDFNYEILVIDSSSNDNSIESIEIDKRISIYSISQKDFQHGKTRNLAVSLSKGEFVAFLTQDALPFNNFWLKNIVKPLISDEDTCAVFGKHIAHKSHSFLTKNSLHDFFYNFKKPFKYRMDDDLTKYFSEIPSKRQFLHYYSDNNSCLRKSYWESFPYQDVDYGEDQLWADWIIKCNKTKAFAYNAIVYHSHDYSIEQEFERCYTEAQFFLKYFGYNISQNRYEIEVGLEKEAKKFILEYEKNYKKKKVNKNHHLNLIRIKREAYKLGVEDMINEILQSKLKE